MTINTSDAQVIAMMLLQIINILPAASRQLIREALNAGKVTKRIAP